MYDCLYDKYCNSGNSLVDVASLENNKEIFDSEFWRFNSSYDHTQIQNRSNYNTLCENRTHILRQLSYITELFCNKMIDYENRTRNTLHSSHGDNRACNHHYHLVDFGIELITLLPFKAGNIIIR